MPFAFTFNCTHHAPLLTELLFHQFTFQQRFLYLLKDGYFTYYLRNRDGSAYVGFDVVIEDVNLLAGDFRYKRQNLVQAIQQSNLIELFLKQQITLTTIYTSTEVILKSRLKMIGKLKPG